MKKIKLNLVMVAIILGTVGAFAFKAPSHKTNVNANLYWFAYDDNGDIIQPTTEPSLGTDPFGCNGHDNLCASGYSQTPVHQMDGTWAPQGSPVSTDFKP